jgi:hypothetical protein
MKHPGDELYDDLKLHFEEMKVPGIGAELAEIAKIVEGGATAEDAAAAFQRFLAAVKASRGGELSSSETAEVIEALVRTSADEYAEGVKDGKVINAHEYQDAWGFILAANALLQEVSAEEREEHKEFAEIADQLAALQPLWPDVSGKSAIEADPSLLAGAVSRIELAASGIK